MDAVWRIEMLGTLRVVSADAEVTRFRTRRVALLLATLAVFRNRVHFREELAESLWPDGEPEVTRRNLRQALTSLRHILEPPPLPAGSILQVQQSRLRLNPELVVTDVAEFELAIAEARRKTTLAERAALLQKAVERYRGDLLPGFDEEWIIHERLRLDDLFVFALRQMVEQSQAAGDPDQAIQYLRMALAKEPLNEEWHLGLMRQYLASNRPSAARQQFEELTVQLREQLGVEPSREAEALLDRAGEATGAGSPMPRATPPTPEREPGGEEIAETRPRASKLPLQITRFCGRQEEIERTLSLLLERGARLTTLVGPAGTGKTRLSVEIGRRLVDEGWNVWFVPLADLTSGAMVPDAVLDTLRARRSGPQDPIDQLREALRDTEKGLLILDNLEHILDETAPVIAEIGRRLPELRVLTTSRQVLRLEAEHQVSVPPLPVPFGPNQWDPVDAAELALLAEYPSVQLFVDRCQTVRPDFQLTLNNARAIATICAKLEGVPLAIELAAGLSSSFAPTQMVHHLEKRLTALTSRRRDMPARHRTLRAAIDYSYETLSPELRRFFAALSVFRGGFTVESAFEVCFRDASRRDSAVRRHPHDVCLDLVLELQERSLIRSESSDEHREVHFRMLESFREYAEEHLSESDLRELRARHAGFFRTHPPAFTHAPSTEERTQRHLWIESEFDNFIAALDFLFEEGDFEGCIRLLETLATTWSNRGPRSIERKYIRMLADRTEAERIDPATRILLLRMLGTTYIRSSEYAAAERACRVALGVAEANGLTDQIAVCYTALATCAGYLGKLDECLALSQRVLEIVPEENLLQRERAYLGIGAVHWGRGEFGPAEEAFRHAADYSSRLRSGEPDTLILYNLARFCLDQGRMDEAMTRLGEAMRICRRVHDDFGLAMCLSVTSRYHWLKGHLAAAIATGHEALRKHRETDFLHWSLIGIFQHALILTDLGEAEAATILLAASEGIGKEARLPDLWDQEAAIAKIRVRLSDAAFERAWAKGLSMDTDEAFRLALRFK